MTTKATWKPLRGQHKTPFANRRVLVFTLVTPAGTTTKRVIPIQVQYGTRQPFPSQDDWLLAAWDLDKEKTDTFRLVCIQDLRYE